MSDLTNEAGEHVYDGIVEYDNPLPGWWTALFWGSIWFSIIYLFVNFTQPQFIDTELTYERAVTKELERQFATLGALEPDESTLLGFLEDPEQEKWLRVGEAIFQTNCVSCHARDGSGIAGPNMTDDHYKNITSLAEIPGVVADGANNGAMPAWSNRLQTNEIVLVSAYVASLRGLNLPGRVAEGDVIPPWSGTN